MFEHLRLKLKGFKEEPFSFEETLDSKYRNYQYELTVIEDNRVLRFALDDIEDDVNEIASKVCKETFVRDVIFTDFRNHKHFYKEVHNA